MNRVATFVVGLAVGLAIMGFVAARERAAAQADQIKNLESLRNEACHSLGYDQAEIAGASWTCMDVELEHEYDDEDEHHHEQGQDHES